MVAAIAAALASPPIGTRTAPAVEVFASPDAAIDRLVLLTEEAIFIANPDRSRLGPMAAELQSGIVASAVLDGAKVIPYAAVASVQVNRHRADMIIRHTEGSQTGVAILSFTGASTRDRVFASLGRRIGSSFKRTDVQFSRFRASIVPVLSAAGFAAFTLVSIGAADEIAAGEDVVIRGRARTHKAIFVWLLELLGPAGIAVLGGLIVAGCLAWWVARMKKPPLMVTLNRRS